MCRNSQSDQQQEPAGSRARKLSAENELSLVLVRLRLGLFELDLADRFNTSQSTISRIFMSRINLLYLKLSILCGSCGSHVLLWTTPCHAFRPDHHAFKDKYPSTRVIIDVTEIRCVGRSSLGLQSSTYLTYKSANTFKGLIGVAPKGLTTFVSELFRGCSSDRVCVIMNGFLSFEENDTVMADKGSRIDDRLEKKKVHLNAPRFLSKGELSEEQVLETKKIASLQIHVERRMHRVKTFQILDRLVPLTLRPVINQMWTVAVLLMNFQSPLINDD